MERPTYLQKYLFDWEVFDVIIGGRSSMDSKFFITSVKEKEDVRNFLKNYGLDPSDPVAKAELYGNYQEAIQFIKRFFLKSGNEEGLDLEIPEAFNGVIDINDVFLMATGSGHANSKEIRLWAEIILKVMHTIIHLDKDIRANYFTQIQTQVFDRFYKYIQRNEKDELLLKENGSDDSIPLVYFEAKARKRRESIIIKLLHKAENVAEELFDRIGLRFVTESRFDILRVCRFLIEKNIIIPHNIKPSRSINSLIDLKMFKERHQRVIKMAIRNGFSEKRFQQAMEREIRDCLVEKNGHQNLPNGNSLDSYRSIQFTCRQLIKYKNPFLKDFYELRKSAQKEENQGDLSKQILEMDVSLIAKDIRFFYPYEIQIIDKETYEENTKGSASHSEYKKVQVKSATRRLFSALLEYKNISY